MTARRTAAAMIALLMGGMVHGAGQDPAQQPPVFRSGVELVSIDVSVLDRHGDPVRGLAHGDFKVTVDGQPRSVVSAEFVDVAAARARRAARPELDVVSSNEGAGIGRQIVFVVDQNTLETGTARYVARAAQRFFDGLTFADRTGLVLLPVGKGLNLTWSHDQVQNALARLAGMNTSMASWEYGSLSEARDISNRNMTALQMVAQRECGTMMAGRSGGGVVGGGGGGGGGATGSAGSGSAPPAGGRGGGGGGGTTTPSSGGGGGGGMGGCMRNIQLMAETTWRVAHLSSLASLASLRQVIETLGRVPGDKTVILLSGGMPLDQHEEVSSLRPVAQAAAMARVTLFPIFVPRSRFSAGQSSISSTPGQDQNIQSGPLHHIANMTGGEVLRAEVSADSAFDRLARQMAGYYRIGIERNPGDADGKPRRLDVGVPRGGVTVRAREIFDLRTFEDRNWTARLATALDSPVPADGIPLRLTSYVGIDPENRSRLTLMLAGAASRIQAGEATLQVVVRDLDGKKVLSGEPPVSHATPQGLEFAMNVPVLPGSYVVRVGVMDSAGHVGSVEHRVEARRTPVGALAAMGPLLVRVPAGAGLEPRIALGGAGQDERLALEIALEGDGGEAEAADVVFEIATTADGPALIKAPGSFSRAAFEGTFLVQAVADLRVLPPGEYVARAKVKAGNDAGELRRWFTVTDPRTVTPPAVAGATTPAAVSPSSAPVPLSARSVGAVRPFALDHVLAPPVLSGFLERVAARPDAGTPMIRELVERARTEGITEVPVSDTLAAQSPVAAFLRGLKFFTAKDYPAAATAFRASMRAAPDMFPAMVYLGACYAAGGKDREAAGAWQTALIRAGDQIALHRLLVDALLRMGSGDRALQAVERARAQWPDDQGLNHQFVVAALLGGKPAEGLQALDRLVDKGEDVDEPTLALAILVLYEGFDQKRPVENPEADRARILRLADRYRARGGPSLALVDTWVAAIK